MPAKPRGVPIKVASAMRAYETGDLPLREVAARYGIAQSTLSEALARARRRVWPEDEVTC